jgi:ABC-type nitrate/sulfonate/bicarbonate transport system substrate-binding protein
MIKGETFAGILNPPFDAKALAAGMRRIGDSKEVLPDYPNTIFAVNREWGQKNRDTLVSYLRAWLKGMSWVKDPANREAAIKAVGAELKLNPKQAAESVDELSRTGNLNLPGLQVVLDLRNQFGFKLIKGDKLPVYYDAAYFNAAREVVASVSSFGSRFSSRGAWRGYGESVTLLRALAYSPGRENLEREL